MAAGLLLGELPGLAHLEYLLVLNLGRKSWLGSYGKLAASVAAERVEACLRKAHQHREAWKRAHI